MDYGTADSVLSIIEYMQRIGKEASVQLLNEPSEADLSDYDTGNLVDLVATNRGERIFDAAFPYELRGIH